MNNNEKNGSNGNERIAALKARERQIREAIARETVKRKKQEFRQLERLKTVIGSALLATAAEDPTFALHLKERLQKAALVESEKNFLLSKGWL
jgi:hypothetical protein